ncbi:MAG: hypothetical protein JOZ24_03225, partial [Candidatus Eremiobacteraeota bacterium]|nr:hypothetical protein [Candidatus Eremiobacteraeota bacterium]
MNRLAKNAALAALAAIAAGCTSAGSAVEPTVTQANLSQNTLQFAVGTANFNGTVGLNTVSTYRQPSGVSGVLLSTPTITGPGAFKVNASNASPSSTSCASAGNDAGTNTISGSPQVDPSTGAAPTPSTFLNGGGVFAYGIAPENSTTAGSASYTLYAQPCYTSGSALTSRTFRGGPPLYPNPRNGTYPSSFVGWTQGWDAFIQTTLATGAYTLSVNVPSSNAAGITQTASATLSNLTPLGVVAAPVFARAGANGGTVTFTAPAGTTESIVYVVDTSNSTHGAGGGATIYYSALATGAGPQTVTFPDNIGPNTFGAAASPTFETAAVATQLNGGTATAGDTL